MGAGRGVLPEVDAAAGRGGRGTQARADQYHGDNHTQRRRYQHLALQYRIYNIRITTKIVTQPPLLYPKWKEWKSTFCTTEQGLFYIYTPSFKGKAG